MNSLLHNINTEITYAVPQTNQPQKKGETPVFRHPLSDGIDLNIYKNRYSTLLDVYKHRFIDHPEDKCFGRRELDETGHLSNLIHWYSNGWVIAEAEAFGSGLLALNLTPVINEWNNYALKFVGVYAKNSMEYLITDIACAIYGITTVPIYDTLGEEATLFAFSQTKMTTCIVTTNHVEKILTNRRDHGHYEHLKTLIVADPENLKHDVAARIKTDIQLLTFANVKSEGRLKIQPWANVQPSDIYTFSYTSGTTGEPKGAMMSHAGMCTVIVAVQDMLKMNNTDSYVDYLPMAHAMERIGITAMHSANVPIFIFSGDVLKLKEDLAIAQPTIFISVPRLYNRFYDLIQRGISEKKGLARKLIGKAIQTKLNNLATRSQYTHSIYDRIVFKKMQQALGGRVRIMITESAPMKKEVQDFLKIAFACPMYEVYGQTEGTGLEFSTRVEDPMAGHVGGPVITFEYKLVDVPEMKYTSKDKDENGYPQPRGEIWVRGPSVIPGYYKADEKNKETFTPDGWLMSGDVGMICGKERRLKIIDRKKNIFKLAQGEYIAPEKLENIYKLAHGEIASVFVYGDSLKNFLIGVINIEKPGVLRMAKEFGLAEDSAEALATSPAFKKKLLELLNSMAAKQKLNSLEKLKDLHVETELFANLDLLTAAFKLKRFEAKDYYKQTLDALYAKHDS
jgi:long-chain acyl-CoA synthetase